MKKLLPLLLVLYSISNSFAQITVDTSFTTQQLIEDILISSPCASVSNFASFTGTASGTNGIAAFNANSSGFPISSGVVLSTGQASSAPGPNGATQLSEGGAGWTADPDNQLATVTGGGSLFNESNIEFTFVPTIDNITFDFLFASEEYIGNFQCSFSDVFAFILTDSMGNSTNLAVIPGTTTPVRVTTVRGRLPGSACGPLNENFFGQYNTPGSNSNIDFNGQTEVLQASSPVTIGETYTIKLAIADDTDTQYDAAVFVGNFKVGADIGGPFTIAAGQPGCDGSVLPLDATSPPGSTYVWMKDGMPLTAGDGTTLVNGGAILNVTQDGNYSVEITLPSGCITDDDADVEFTDPPVIAGATTDLFICETDGNGVEIFDLRVNGNAVLGTQDPAKFILTYHQTLADAQNYNGTATANTITSPATFQNVTAMQTIWVRIADQTQTCFEIASFSIEVQSLPVPVNPGPFELCDDTASGSDVDGLSSFDLTTLDNTIRGALSAANYNVKYYLDQTAADAGVAGTEITSPYQNTTANTQNIVARLSNNAINACYGTIAFDLVVNALPVINDPTLLLQCDNDIDGITTFNLEEANVLLSANSVNENFSYYLTRADAEAGTATGQIANPTIYVNPTPVTSVVFARIASIKGCYRTAQVNLQVSTTQLPAGFSRSYNACDDSVDGDNINGVAAFDFSDATADLLALFPSGQSLTVTYYENEADGLAELNAIPDITNHRNTASPFTQTIWVRVDSDFNNACLGVADRITLTVDPLPLTNPIADFWVCSDDTVVGVFDLTTKDAEVRGTQTQPLLISYHLSEADAENNVPIANSTSFSNTTNPQIVWVRSHFDDNGNGLVDAGECARTDMSFELQVRQNPVLTAPTPIVQCNTMVNTTYDLTQRYNEIVGGDTSIVLEYFETPADEMANTPIATPANYLSTQLINDITIRATGTNTCNSITTLRLRTIIFDLIDTTPDFLQKCEDDNDGFEVFNLRDSEVDILEGLTASDFIFTYYEDPMDADMGNMNNITVPETFTNTDDFVQTIYVRVTPRDITNICYQVVPLELRVEQNPQIDLEDSYILCLNADDSVIDTAEIPRLVIDTELDFATYEFFWFMGADTSNIANAIPGEINSVFRPDVPGTYSVRIFNRITRCENSDTTEVIGSYPPESISAEVTTDFFSDTHTVQATVVGVGQYEFKLDNGPWQLSGLFEDVRRGEHTVYVRDIFRCIEDGLPYEIFIIDYPKYFTPNGDGFNDTWNITSINRLPTSKIYIFDRLGKLLKELSPIDGAWDGTVNGTALPASDYWFRVTYIEDTIEKEFKGHFSLKR